METKKNFLGLPWWLVFLGGGALIYLLMKNAPSSAADTVQQKIAKLKAQHMNDYPGSVLSSVISDGKVVKVTSTFTDGKGSVSTEANLSDL